MWEHFSDIFQLPVRGSFLPSVASKLQGLRGGAYALYRYHYNTYKGWKSSFVSLPLLLLLPWIRQSKALAVLDLLEASSKGWNQP